jgi:hypothetical protein
MNIGPAQRSDEFLKTSAQFKLGALVTANLSAVAKQDIAAALKLLFDVEADVIRKYREFAEPGRAGGIEETILRAREKLTNEQAEEKLKAQF